MLALFLALAALSCPPQSTTTYTSHEAGISFEATEFWTQSLPFDVQAPIYLSGIAADEAGYLPTEFFIYSNTFKGKSSVKNAKKGMFRDGILTPLKVKSHGTKTMGEHEVFLEVFKAPSRPKAVYKYILLREDRYYLLEFTSHFEGKQFEEQLAMVEDMVSSVRLIDIWTSSKDLATDRKAHPTRITKKLSAPQNFEPFDTPARSKLVRYRSGKLKLPALVSADPGDKKKHPAVVFAHGGFAFGTSDWDQCQAYRDAGFVVMTPILRGENDASGTFELFYGEVDDLVAAGRHVAKLSYVDRDRVFIAGHSIGGTHAALAAMVDSPYRAAASFSGSFYALERTSELGDRTPFDWHDSRETRLRSPVYYGSSLRCPLKLYYGEAEATWFEEETALLVNRAIDAKKSCSSEIVPGDHWQAVAPAILSSIEFFNSVADPAPIDAK